jgi:hypothetical protein
MVIDHVADIDADAELHAALGLNWGIALCHRGLDGERAFDRVHHAGKLGENAVSGGIDNAPGKFADHREHDRLVRFEIAHRARFIRAHQGAVAGDVGRQNGGKPPLHALLRHFGRTLAYARVKHIGAKISCDLLCAMPGLERRGRRRASLRAAASCGTERDRVIIPVLLAIAENCSSVQQIWWPGSLGDPARGISPSSIRIETGNSAERERARA